MDNEYYLYGFPKWILKILPVLTGHLSLKDFEIWLYSPQSKDIFPNDVYLELISFDYTRGISDFFDCMQIIFSCKSREVLNDIIGFIREPRFSSLPNWDDFLLLPVSPTLLEFIWDRILELLGNVFLSEKHEEYEEFRLNNALLFLYLERIILLLKDYEKYTEIEIRRELNTIFRSERNNLLKGIK